MRFSGRSVGDHTGGHDVSPWPKPARARGYDHSDALAPRFPFWRCAAVQFARFHAVPVQHGWPVTHDKAQKRQGSSSSRVGSWGTRLRWVRGKWGRGHMLP